MGLVSKCILSISISIFVMWILEVDGGGHLHNILSHPLIQCRLKGGTCLQIDSCNTTVNIYKDICKSYNYHDVCCISRVTVCHKFSGFCTNNSNTCLQAGRLFKGGAGIPYRPVVYSWLRCNSTHRCCHPIQIKKKISHHGIGHGGGHHHGSQSHFGGSHHHGGQSHFGGHHHGGHHGGHFRPHSHSHSHNSHRGFGHSFLEPSPFGHRLRDEGDYTGNVLNVGNGFIQGK